MLAIEDLVAQLRHDYETHVHPAEDRFLRITTHQADLGSVEGCVGLLEDVRKAQGMRLFSPCLEPECRSFWWFYGVCK